MLSYQGGVGEVQAFLARPQGSEPRPAIIVIHDIAGLRDHTKDVAQRFVEQGYVALAPHLFSRPELGRILTRANIAAALQFMAGLDPQRRSDMAYIGEEMARLPEGQRQIVGQTNAALFGDATRDGVIQDLRAAVDFLNSQSYVKTGQIASLGFCWGGGMSFQLACHARLAGSVVFYGSNPTPLEGVADIAGPVLGLYGGEDMRINADLDKLVKAVVEARLDFEMRLYPGARHAFFDDTNPQVYHEAAARESWDRVLRFFRRTLAA
jgi:carboxymethylenebutenolidase